MKSVMMEIERAGNINYLAEEEFNDAKNNLEFYTKQLSDLEKAPRGEPLREQIH